MLLLYLQDADLNVKHLKMLFLAEVVLSGDGQEGCTLYSAVWQQGHWPWGRWFQCLLCSNTCLAQRAFPVLLWHSLERVADVVLGVMSSSSLQEWGQTLCSPALKSCSELRDQQSVFPVAQSSCMWHSKWIGKVCEPVAAFLLYSGLLIPWGDTRTACFILSWSLFLNS